QLTPGSATATGPGRFVSNATTLTILTGLSASGAQVVLYANGTAVAQLAGAEPLTFTFTPPEGQVEFVAQAVDAAGNVSFFTVPLDVTVDRMIPPLTVMLDPASASGRFGPGAHTTLSQVTLDGTAKSGATVTLVGTPLVTQATGGKFTLSGVPLKP